eukprot:2232502-Rhodomonas_salina.1
MYQERGSGCWIAQRSLQTAPRQHESQRAGCNPLPCLSGVDSAQRQRQLAQCAGANTGAVCGCNQGQFVCLCVCLSLSLSGCNEGAETWVRIPRLTPSRMRRTRSRSTLPSAPPSSSSSPPARSLVMEVSSSASACTCTQPPPPSEVLRALSSL